MKKDKIFLSSDVYFTMDKAIREFEAHLDYEDYLYRSYSSKTPFISYEQELKRINGYLVILLENSNQNRQEELDLYDNWIPDADDIIGDGEIELAKEEVDTTWSFNINQTLFCLGITLLLSFLESCLLELSQYLDSSFNYKKVNGKKLEAYLKILNQSLNLNLTLSKQLLNSRKIRNEFIHNQFKYSDISQKELRYTIDAIVDLLFKIETTMINNGIL